MRSHETLRLRDDHITLVGVVPKHARDVHRVDIEGNRHYEPKQEVNQLSPALVDAGEAVHRIIEPGLHPRAKAVEVAAGGDQKSCETLPRIAGWQLGHAALNLREQRTLALVAERIEQ